MKLSRKIIDWARSVTPDWIRWNLGPYVAYGVYVFRMHVLGNKDAPKVLSMNDTLDLIIKNDLSVIRFGDGEMTIIGSGALGFQKADPVLARRLKKIIQLNLPGLLICVPGFFGKLEDLADFAFKFALHHQFRYRHQWLDLLSLDQTYGETGMTRPYLGFNANGRKKSGEIFRKLFSLWQGRDVLLIEGSKSRLGVGNNMFDEVASLKRILCPPENAYDKYNEILTEALKTERNKLILVSLGPTAKVLVYDLFKAGYRVIDIGHIDMEYEMYLRKEPIQTKVKYKYFNEIKERDPVECLDSKYLSEIIAKIL